MGLNYLKVSASILWLIISLNQVTVLVQMVINTIIWDSSGLFGTVMVSIFVMSFVI